MRIDVGMVSPNMSLYADREEYELAGLGEEMRRTLKHRKRQRLLQACSGEVDPAKQEAWLKGRFK